MTLRTIQQALPSLALSLNISQYQRADATAEMKAGAEGFEKRFSIEFATLTHFPKASLASLHHFSPSDLEQPANTTVASVEDPSLLLEMGTLTEVANSVRISVDDRRRYYDALKRIYAKLPRNPDYDREDPNTLFVGIEREGRMIAESVDCLPAGHSIRPHAKRIWLDDGLLVGFTGIPPLPTFGNCVVIDGAIASGSTLIALLMHLHPFVNSFRIFSAHATFEGLHALARFASAAHLDVSVVVGHATKGINEHYYAITEEDPKQVVVGDLGDTISELEQKQ